jgi:hypothetical protein
MATKQPHQPGNPTSVHSVRVSDSMWEAAKRRSKLEGVTMNFVVAQILEGYGRGLVDLPRVTKVYQQTRPLASGE